MNTRINKEEIALQMPSSLGHYFKDDPDYMPVPEQSGVDLFGKLRAAARWIAELPKRRAVLDELNALSDHELSDIGLSRAELGQVFDPAFVGQRATQTAGAHRPVTA